MHWLYLEGKFSVKTAYELKAGRLSEGQWAGWKWIWRFRFQQRVKVLLWMLAHERILTNFIRWRRGIAYTSDCWRCNGESEDALHVI